MCRVHSVIVREADEHLQMKGITRDKNLTFKYSLFYILQPILGIGLVCLFLFASIFLKPLDLSKNYQFIALIILICFFIFMIIKGVFIISKRTNEPSKIKVDDEAVSAIYRNGKVIEILWDDIKKIQIRRDRWRFGAESMEIISKENSREIIINDDINGYKILRSAIIDRKKERTEIA